MEGAVLIRDIMTKTIKTIRADDNVRDAVRKMIKFGIGSLVVIEGKRPVGIMTEDDVLRKVVEPCLDPTTLSVRSIMSSPLIVINEEASIEEAVRLMMRKGVRRLPVMRGTELVGIVTSTDISRQCPAYISLLGELKRPS